jgi:hypothetical protein
VGIRATREPERETVSMADKITEAEISTLVDTFYAKVRRDPDIGPIFNAIVGDWPHHLATPDPCQGYDPWMAGLLADRRSLGLLMGDAGFEVPKNLSSPKLGKALLNPHPQQTKPLPEKINATKRHIPCPNPLK